MASEFLTELGNKIDSLIVKVQTLKHEKDALEQDVATKDNKIRELETQSGSMQEESRLLKISNEELQKKLGDAADKIQGILSKLDSVE